MHPGAMIIGHWKLVNNLLRPYGSGKAKHQLEGQKNCFLTRLLQLPRHVTRNSTLEHPGVFFAWASCGLPSWSMEYVIAYFFFGWGGDVKVKLVILSLCRCMVRRVYI